MIDEDDIWDYNDYIDRTQKGEPLFIDNEERTLLDKDNEYAYMGYKRRSLYSFASAYKKAADKLVQSIKNNPIGFDDDLALPIVYLHTVHCSVTASLAAHSMT
nr:hypothetical protein [Ktedonobacteraceae bacterium]